MKMKKELTMPALKETMTEGVFCAWLKEEGDSFRKGDALFEIETDKVVNQVEAETDGTLVRKLVEEGDKVAVNAPVAEVKIG